MSKFDEDKFVDYEKLASNIKIVRERYIIYILVVG